MFQRLIVPLALRSLILSIGIAAILCIFLAPEQLLQGEPTVAATLRGASPSISWSGQPAESNDLFDQASCIEARTCDVFRVKVDVSNQYLRSHPDFALSVR